MEATGARLRLIAALSTAVVLSQFFRNSSGVIAPELSRELDLSPAMLGFANAAFFIALGVVQVPAGILFDRIGVRRTFLGLIGFAVAGSLLQAVAESGAGLALARFLQGIGCGAGSNQRAQSSTTPMKPARLATAVSWIFALSQVGILLAATPLAAATATWGWRPAFVVAAVVTAGCGLLYAAWVRDDPPGAPPRPAHRPEDAAFAGLLRVLRTPHIGYLLALHLFAYAAVATLTGLWVGPYLADVHGLAPVARGHVLLAMGLAQLFGQLAIGPLDRRFDTRKWIVAPSAAASVAVLVLLALLEQPPLWAAVLLLVLLSVFSQYPVLIVAHARSFFPAAIAGRGVTTVNLAQVTGASVLPYATGLVVGAAAAGVEPAPEHAYRLAFAAIAAPLAIGLAFYLRARDAKPSQGLSR